MIPRFKKDAEIPLREISRNKGRVVPATIEVQVDECGSDDGGGGLQRSAPKK